MSNSSVGRYAFFLRLLGSFLRMSRGYRRLVSVIPASAESQEGGSQSKRASVLSRIAATSEDLEMTNNILGGLLDFLGGLADVIDCTRGAPNLSTVLREARCIAARWSTHIFHRIYHLKGSKEQAESPARLPNQAPEQAHWVVHNIEEAHSAIQMWRKDKHPIDIPDSMAPELAENIWQIFLEHGVPEVIESAPLLAGKIGQQKILSEKVKSTRVRLKAKEEQMKELEAHLVAVRADISSFEEQLHELSVCQRQLRP